MQRRRRGRQKRTSCLFNPRSFFDFTVGSREKTRRPILSLRGARNGLAQAAELTSPRANQRRTLDSPTSPGLTSPRQWGCLLRSFESRVDNVSQLVAFRDINDVARVYRATLSRPLKQRSRTIGQAMQRFDARLNGT